MKKCVNCGAQNPDDALNCESCSTTTFVALGSGAIGGHMISPAEERFWERMTFRQFAVVVVRLQALWFLFYGLIEATYLTRYTTGGGPFALYISLTTAGKLDMLMLILRILLYVAAGIAGIQFTDRILSWLVKDTIPKKQPVAQTDNPAA
jgi:hypothetical protein